MKRATNHFMSYHAAMLYYVGQGYEVRDIQRKHLEHEFEVGAPEHRAHESLCTEHGQYFIEDGRK